MADSVVLREPSPAQDQFPITLATGQTPPFRARQTIEFERVNHRQGGTIRVTLEQVEEEGRFTGTLPQGHRAAGRLPTATKEGFITISFVT